MCWIARENKGKEEERREGGRTYRADILEATKQILIDLQIQSPFSVASPGAQWVFELHNLTETQQYVLSL